MKAYYMDALSFLKLLWRPTPIPTNATAKDTQSSFAETDDDPDDSFFDLNVTLSDLDAKSCDSPKIPFNVDDDDVVLKFHESNSTPTSPISILMSSPSFRGQMFGKSRDAERQIAGEEEAEDGSRAKKTARRFTVRFKVKEVVAAGGDGSLKRNNSDPKDGFMKYLKPFRVSYVGGASRKCGYVSDDKRFATCRFSPSSSPVAPPKKGKPESGFQVGYKNLGKCKSAILSSTAAANGGGRTDDSMAEQREGIHGAILHCKKSYYHLE